MLYRLSCVGYLFLSLACSLRVVWGAELNRNNMFEDLGAAYLLVQVVQV